MRNRLTAVLLLASSTMVSFAETDYQTLLEAVKKYQDGFSDTNALQTIYTVARSDDYEELVTRCMGIYTLHMGAIGNAGACQGGCQALINRHPESEVAKKLRDLPLFQDACSICQGLGVVKKNSIQDCSTCLNTGRCGKCAGSGRVNRGVTGLRGPVSRSGGSSTTWQTGGNIIFRSTTRGYSRSVGSGNLSDSSDPTTIQCSECRGSGRCPACLGDPKKERLVNVRCPSCFGVSKGVNLNVVQNNLAYLCRDAVRALGLAIGCEGAFSEINGIKIEGIKDLYKQSEALDVALNKYDIAFNAELLTDLKKGVTTKIEETEKGTREAKDRILKEHSALLIKIRGFSSKQLSLTEMRKFIDENPDSPLLAEAKLTAVELEDQLKKESREKDLKRNIMIGGISLGVLLFVVWFLTCFKVTWVRYTYVGRSKKNPGKRNSPNEPVYLPSGMSPTGNIRLDFQTVSDNEANSVVCPECGAMLNCPRNIREENVICAGCNKAFHVH